MGELGALFNPGMRHELEERRSRAARREEEGNARDGDLRIDLESGVAVINAPGDETEGAGSAVEPPPAQPAPDAGSATGNADSTPGTGDAPGPAGEADSDRPAQVPLRPRGKRAAGASRR